MSTSHWPMAGNGVLHLQLINQSVMLKMLVFLLVLFVVIVVRELSKEHDEYDLSIYALALLGSMCTFICIMVNL